MDGTCLLRHNHTSQSSILPPPTPKKKQNLRGYNNVVYAANTLNVGFLMDSRSSEPIRCTIISSQGPREQ
jgi:hypothetical protein